MLYADVRTLRSCTCFTQPYLFYAAVRFLHIFTCFTQLYMLYAAVRASRSWVLAHFMQLYASKHLCVKMCKAVITLRRLYARRRPHTPALHRPAPPRPGRQWGRQRGGGSKGGGMMASRRGAGPRRAGERLQPGQRRGRNDPGPLRDHAGRPRRRWTLGRIARRRGWLGVRGCGCGWVANGGLRVGGEWGEPLSAMIAYCAQAPSADATGRAAAQQGAAGLGWRSARRMSHFGPSTEMDLKRGIGRRAGRGVGERRGCRGRARIGGSASRWERATRRGAGVL
jgi:hypothetical protein